MIFAPNQSKNNVGVEKIMRFGYVICSDCKYCDLEKGKCTLGIDVCDHGSKWEWKREGQYKQLLKEAAASDPLFAYVHEDELRELFEEYDDE